MFLMRAVRSFPAIRSFFGSVLLLPLVLFMPAAMAQSCLWSRIDREMAFSDSGIWKPNAYRSMMDVLSIAQIGGALWEGSDSRIGRTMWQGMDAQLLGGAAGEMGKRIFRRERPGSENNPCRWFRGGSNASFPSGEASAAAALVAPYVLEYGHDHPAIYGLLAVPLYVGVGRLKNRAHWPTDVLAGWGVGAASGWYAHDRETPILVSLLPRGITIGWNKSF